MSPQKRKGFTVIELLVAVGVTALLVTLMINIVSTVLSNWNRTSGSLSTGNQARLILDQISQDLQGAIFKTDGNVWMAASVQDEFAATGIAGESWPGGAKPADTTPATGTEDSLRLLPSGLNLEDYRFGQAGVWLRFFTIPSGENIAGDLSTISAPRAVSYQIVRRLVGGSSSEQYAYQLFRAEVFPNNTFTQGYNLFEPGGYNTANAAGVGAVQNIRSPDPDQVIANGIVDFGIRIYAENSATGNMTEVFPVDRRAGGTTANSAFAATTNSTLADPGTGLASANVTKAFPTVAEVMIRVLTPEGIRLLEAKEDTALSGNIPQSWWEIVEQNSQVYTRRIDLKSTAL